MQKLKQKQKSILVIGMGRFGRHLALNMQEMGHSVMVADNNPNMESDLSNLFENYVIGDCTNEHVLHALGIPEFDVCFVTIGKHFESSIIITSRLKTLGAERIVTKAGRAIQTEVLKKIGADEIVYPEKEMAEKLAVRYSASNILDYIELSGDYSVFEITVPEEWIGKTIGALDVRRKYNVNILALKHDTEIRAMPSADCMLCAEDIVVLMGKDEDVFRLTAKANR